MMRNKIIIGVVIVLVIISITFFLFIRKNGSDHLTYDKTKISRGNLDVIVLSTGIVEPENRLEIKPPIPGRVESVLVDEGDKVKKGQILFWMSSTERAALLDAARARGQAELKRWEEFYKATPVLAPIDGTVILRNIESGQTFTSQDAVLIMSDRLTVEAQVDETDISQIKLKQKADILLDAYPSEKIPARVVKVAYDATTISNVTTYLVDVLPDKTPIFMKSGMTANVSFLVDAKENILVLPTEAIKVREGKTYVATDSLGADGKLVEKEVKTGSTDGKKVEIVSGVSEGDLVLVPKIKIMGEKSNGTNPFSPFGRPRQSR